jgi:hypothetical protein
MTETAFENKVAILADLWLGYRNDETFEDFIIYNDLGLPLAYLLDNGIVDKTDKAVGFIDETFALLLTGLEQEDTGFTSLNNLLDLPEEE